MLTTATHLTSTLELPHHPGMDRRRFLLTSLAGALASPLAAEAQTSKVYRIGFLGRRPPQTTRRTSGFPSGAPGSGYEEGKNISIEYRWANGRYERLPTLAAELVRLNPDVLVTHATPGIRAAKQATTTIPIVMGVSADPVRLGFVKSLAQPGGNTTGVATMRFDLAAKRLELFKEAIPTSGMWPFFLIQRIRATTSGRWRSLAGSWE